MLGDSPRFDRWMAHHRTDTPTSSNQPALELPFQRWFKFKEAFSPRFILDCFDLMGRAPRRCLDPFGGSGTTALTCQFADVQPATIEVNPFLADLIEAKLSSHNIERLQRDFLSVCQNHSRRKPNLRKLFAGGPATLVEPGVKGRWIYNREVAQTIAQIRLSIDELAHADSRRVLRVALGSVLVELSNAVVNGKGRRYRSNWQLRPVKRADVLTKFSASFSAIFEDLCLYADRNCREFQLLRGDSRLLVGKIGKFDAAIFSPPYPNSFDYTDIYNLELWMLGYLDTKSSNQSLRRSTLRSHVQVSRPLEAKPIASTRLRRLYAELSAIRGELWDDRLPEMVISYFEDMRLILADIHASLESDGRVFMAVGNSQYAGVRIDVPKILADISENLGFEVISSHAIRSMRTSAQQGGEHDLAESLVVLAPAR